MPRAIVPLVAVSAVLTLMLPAIPAGARPPSSTVGAPTTKQAKALLGAITAPADQAPRERSKVPFRFN